MNILIFGGTSGLGLELARKYKQQGDSVIVVGRKDPKEFGIEFREFNLWRGSALADDIEDFIGSLPKTDVCIYSAGFYQKGTVTDLTNDDIEHMLDVGLRAPLYIVREILQQHGEFDTFVAISSTSQKVPRKLEPIYTAVKAGLAQFANSLSLDGRVTRVLNVVPAGMNTEFWRMTGHDKTGYNNPVWVAEQVLENLEDEFTYRSVDILRDPPRIEITEER